MVRRAAAFPAASSVGVARSPRVAVPSIPRVISGGWWVCAGVICTASDACFGGACWGVVSAASPICSDFQTFCPDWLHFGHFLCFGGFAASQLSHRIFPIYF